MPTLPSGLHLALLIDHIMEPDTNWFKAPDGHFWYWNPAHYEKQPPYSPEDAFEQEPTTAPVPETREMAERFVRVCIGTDDGMMYWRGEMLSEFPKYGTLSDEDSAVWKEWLAQDKVGEFLDSVVVKCKTQAEINKDATGYPTLIKSNEPEEDQYLKVVENPTKRTN